jgi:hypothetical protein
MVAPPHLYRVNSPPTFSAVTETACDIEQQHVPPTLPEAHRHMSGRYYASHHGGATVCQGAR